jgi:hypothetical protein
MIAPETIAPRYTPLPHQQRVVDYMMKGGKRALLVWHRRSGKDITFWNLTWAKAQERIGIYYYFYPTYSQAKKAIWYGMDEKGVRFLDYIPRTLIESTHDTDMRVHFTNGSILQLIGSDNVDSIMSTNPVGCVFSEYALQDPVGWRFISPILAKNGGWAAFVYTPRGHNHGYELYSRMKNRDGWFTELLTVDDTHLISMDEIDDIRATGVPEEIIQQEFWCDFEISNEGSYFGQQMLQAEMSDRIGRVPYDPRFPVHTAWDIGVNDSCSIWFIQTDGRTVWCIDFYDKANNEGLPYFARLLQERGYFYGTHLGPHDIAKREFGTGDQIRQAGFNLGIDFTTVERTDKKAQHAAAHALIPRTYFDALHCERGIAGLRGYEREWDRVAKVFSNTPKHNWASHIADAFMVLACGIDLIGNDQRRFSSSIGAFDPRTYDKYASFDPRDRTYGQAEPTTREYRHPARIARWEADEPNELSYSGHYDEDEWRLSGRVQR